MVNLLLLLVMVNLKKAALQVAQVQKLRHHLFFDKNGNKLGKITSDDVDGAYALLVKILAA